MILLNLIDLEFYKIKSRRSGIELFSLVSDKSNPVLSYIINYWWLALILFAFIYLLYKSYPNKKTLFGQVKPILWIPIFFSMACFLLLGARGGLYIKPLRSFDAARFVNPAWVSATINSPTQLITSYSASVPKVPQYYTDAECRSHLNPIRTVKPYFKNNFKPNVVLIILESFGRDYCGFLNKEPRFTPFLDSLSKQSLLFINAYSSGTTSMESIPAIFSSIPSLMEVPYINSNFQSNKVHGIHHYLSNFGYDCSFYYGAENGSMGFDNFLKISGKIQYFGLKEYYQTQSKSDFDGHWGIWDEP
ncbi:MAG TPA: sulfatase-like hydrolase/transferase, partial [Bacteroidia bacterium]